MGKGKEEGLNSIIVPPDSIYVLSPVFCIFLIALSVTEFAFPVWPVNFASVFKALCPVGLNCFPVAVFFFSLIANIDIARHQ